MAEATITPADVVDAVADARREALGLIRELCEGVATAATALEVLLGGADEFDAPVDWPLPDDLVKERVQLRAFLATVERMEPQKRNAFREVFRDEMVKARAAQGMLSTHELPTAPALPETKGAYAALRQLAEDIRRSTMLDRDATDAVRALAARRFDDSV